MKELKSIRLKQSNKLRKVEHRKRAKKQLMNQWRISQMYC